MVTKGSTEAGSASASSSRVTADGADLGGWIGQLLADRPRGERGRQVAGGQRAWMAFGDNGHLGAARRCR